MSTSTAVSMDDGRCDYVRLRLPFDAAGKVEAQQQYTDLINDVCGHWGLDFHCYDTHSYYDRPSKTWMAFFNVWGEAAHYFLYALPIGLLKQVQRLDYRVNLGENKIDFKLLYSIMEGRVGNRTTVKRIKSPVRTKRKGRDIGGEGIVVGAEGSRQRFSVYQRGLEGAAIEGQFSSDHIKKILNKALGGEIPDNVQPATLILTALSDATAALLKKYTGTYLDELLCGPFEQYSSLADSPVEKVLTQMDMLWDLLDEDSQQVFISTKTDASEADVARAIDAVKFVEAADWEEDIEPLRYVPAGQLTEDQIQALYDAFWNGNPSHPGYDE